MKRLSLLLFLLAAGWAAADSRKSEPLFRAGITCFTGTIYSGSSCSTALVSLQPNGFTCGPAGQVSEVHWEFIGSKEGADTWRVSRRFPVDAADTRTEVKTIKFIGKRLIVFEDKFQVVVVDLIRETK